MSNLSLHSLESVALESSRKKIDRSVHVIAAILTAIFALSPFGKQLDNAIFDMLLVNIGKPIQSSDIVVVGIDEPSFQQLGLQWPWPRSTHAKLVEQLVKQKARIIAFDLLFPEKTTAREDNKFAAAIKKSKYTLIGTDFKIIKHPQYTIKTPVEPIASLIDAGARTGHVNIPVHADGFVRELQPVLENTPSLAFSAASLFTNGTCCNKVALPPSIHINFSGGTHSFAQVSYYQALDAETYLPNDFFLDKIVLIGVRSLSAALPDRQSADHYATPLTRNGQGYTSGVMIHAFTTASLLGNSWYSVAYPPLVAIAGIFIAFLFIRFAIFDELAISVAVGVILSFAILASILIVFRHQLMYVSTTSGILPLLSVIAITPYHNFLVERRKKKEIRKAFSTYVNEAIVSEIESDPNKLKLGGKQIDGSVLFLDIAGFSALTESEKPETIINFINLFLSEMIDIGMNHDGTVERFLGDAIMLIWGAPLTEPDHAMKACSAAIHMHQKIVELADITEEKFGFRVHARIGINSGSMTAGNIGGENRFAYTVLGDCVNVAARFEAANKTYSSFMIIGENTVAELNVQSHADKFVFRLMDHTTVKGRETPENLYELVDFADAFNSKAAFTSAQKHYNSGLTLLKSGDTEKALEQFSLSDKIYPLSGSKYMQQQCKKTRDKTIL